MAVAATAMRQILIDHARHRQAAKRGGKDWQRVTLDDALDVVSREGLDVLALGEAMSRLAQLSERQARVVELRIFAGLTIEECAEVMGIGQTTVKSEWTIARIWLKRELSERAEA
jgi:RNA polymerase sigma factor (TIGR02999 family)